MSTLSKKNNLFQLSFLTKQAGYVSEHSAYHHGETSLQSTIVGLAQVRETERERVFFLIWKRGEDDDGVSFSHTLFDPTGQRPKKSKKTQNFVGSNNINLLVPQGQFGTRLTKNARAAVGDAVFIGDADDQPAFAGEVYQRGHGLAFNRWWATYG